MTIVFAAHLNPSSYADELADDVRAGLTATPKWLSPKYFYDARGSELFDEITRLPEYYPTRTERGILLAHGGQIAAVTGADTLIELGSGTSEKTRLLLDAMHAGGSLRQFVPFDVDPAILADSSAAIAAQYPTVDVHAVVGDFERHLHLLPAGGRRLIVFLGSTIGNLEPLRRAEFLADVRRAMAPGDAFLLGTDLVKNIDRLVAAYNDSAGITAAFNRNVLAVVNRELGADFDPDAFEHIAQWDEHEEWIEMRLRSNRAQLVHVPAIDLAVDFAEGEDIRTEISAKFRPARVREELRRAGLRLTRWWTDPNADFGLSLSFAD